MPSPRVRALLMSVALAAMLTACASRPTIRTDGDPSVNVASFKTFGFYDSVSTDKNQYTSMLSTRLKDATKRELEKRGFTYTSSGAALLVNFHVNIENQTDVRSTPSTGVGVGRGGYYGYRAGMYGGWAGYPQEVETVHYQTGTLSIDLVDDSKKQLVWQGVAQGRINKKALDNPAAAIERVVGEIFAKFPVAATTTAQ